MATELITKVPFEFQVLNEKMPAGDYEMTQKRTLNTTKVYAVRNKQTQRTVLMLAVPGHAKGSARPYLKFECAPGGVEGCALSEVWTGGDLSYHFAVPKRKSEAKPEVRVLELAR